MEVNPSTAPAVKPTAGVGPAPAGGAVQGAPAATHVTPSTAVGMPALTGGNHVNARSYWPGVAARATSRGSDGGASVVTSTASEHAVPCELAATA